MERIDLHAAAEWNVPMVQQLIAPTRSKDRLAGGEARIPMSYEDYLDWWDMNEGRHGEWVDGEVIVFVSPSLEHQDLVFWLAGVLGTYVKRLGLGRVVGAPFEMRVQAVRSSRLPDLIFMATANLERLTSKRLDGPADLAIEIVSEHSGPRDRREKLDEYAAAGVSEYWIIDPRPLRQKIIVNRLDDEGSFDQIPLDADGSIRSPVLPGLRLPASWLFDDPLPDLVEALDALLAVSPTAKLPTDE